MMEAGKGLWSLIQDQILGMKWLQDAVEAGLTAMGTDISSRLGGSVHFFIYDIIKITILLCTLIFVISYIQSYFHRSAAKGSWAGSMGWEPGSRRPFWER